MVTKIRGDLDGVVYLNGQPYKAGDKVPDDVRVGAHLTADGKDHGYLTPEPPRAVTAGSQTPLTEVEAAKAVAIGLDLTAAEPEWLRGAIGGYDLAVTAQPEPLSDEESTAAEALGLPDDIHPERTRGAIVGYEQGVADSLARAAAGTAFDPSDANIEAVQKHIAENPTETAAVLALEATGKGRRTILDEYLG